MDFHKDCTPLSEQMDLASAARAGRPELIRGSRQSPQSAGGAGARAAAPILPSLAPGAGMMWVQTNSLKVYKQNIVNTHVAMYVYNVTIRLHIRTYIYTPLDQSPRFEGGGRD